MIKITPRWVPVDDSQVVLLKNISCQHRPRQSGNYAVAVNLKLARWLYNALEGVVDDDNGDDDDDDDDDSNCAVPVT